MSRIIVWAGHGPKEPGHDDPGVCSPRAEECEADWTTDLAAPLAVELRRLGHQVDDLVLGPYAQRAALADAAGADLVIHLHGDTGTPGVYAYPGSLHGEAAAGAIHVALEGALPWRVALRSASSSFPRARGLLARTRAPAVLVELVQQVQAEDARWLRAHLDEVAAVIARGVQAWATVAA